MIFSHLLLMESNKVILFGKVFESPLLTHLPTPQYNGATWKFVFGTLKAQKHLIVSLVLIFSETNLATQG